MSTRRRNIVPPALLALLLLCRPVSAHAIDVPPPNREGDSRVSLDASYDASTLENDSVDVNFTLAPFGSIYESGPRVRLSFGTSRYEYSVDGVFEGGRGREGSLLVGYGFTLPRASIIVLVGAAASDSVDGGISRSLSGTRFFSSVYGRPSPNTMAYASLLHSTIQTTWRFQGKLGVKVTEDLFIGPETNLTWRNGEPWNTAVITTRIGVHVSGIKVGPVYLSFSGGWVLEHGSGTGGYVGIGLYGDF